MVWWLSVWACIAVGKSDGAAETGTDGTNSTAGTNDASADSRADDDAESSDDRTEDTAEDRAAGPGDFEGALVTEHCTYEGYPYAVDILLSCGSERFGSELRLHTFKRHSHAHAQVFNDQRIRHRDNQLWFDGYSQPRCIRFAPNGRLMLDTDGARCSTVALNPTSDGFQIAEPATGRCAGLGTAECSDHVFTGGRECGGIDHRYLPLTMGDCDNALSFRVELNAQACAAEYPESACF
ncbi:MAG: hypothetical protein VX127_12300 [Myxococcota bacterium]|nr:hypothetical protein [Myxococcota bacterium]